MSGNTLVLGVGLVEALRVDEADSSQAHCVFLGQKVRLTVSYLLVGHQGVVAVAHPHVCLQVGQLLGHLHLLPLQKLCSADEEATEMDMRGRFKLVMQNIADK